MHTVRYRALITIDPIPRAAAEKTSSYTRQDPHLASIPRQLRNHTHALMVRAHCLSKPSYARCFPAEISWDDEEPLHPGDRAEVTLTMIDDEACAFFGAGQRFSLWNGEEVGHGTISRQVHTEYGPC